MVAPPINAEHGLFAETNDNSTTVLLTCGTVRVRSRRAAYEQGKKDAVKD